LTRSGCGMAGGEEGADAVDGGWFGIGQDAEGDERAGGPGKVDGGAVAFWDGCCGSAVGIKWLRVGEAARRTLQERVLTCA
jgi:hypothetical protein